MKYLFSNSLSGQRARLQFFRSFKLMRINWELISRCLTYSMAVIGVVLLTWIGIIAYFIALGAKFNQ